MRRRAGYQARLLRLRRAGAGDDSGTAAVEFAIVAPAIVAALLAMIDVGFALEARMRMDAILRTGAQIAMADPGLSDLRAGLDALADGSAITVDADLRCRCPDATCTEPCSDPADYTAYRMTATLRYDSIVTPLTMDLDSSVEVEVR